MGLFDDDDDEINALIQEASKFKPLELNVLNVQSLFNRCLVTKDDPTGGILSSTLFQKAFGYDEDSKPVFFSKKRIEQNRKSIFYILGQLRSVHKNDLKITSTESIYRYDNVKWTSDTVKLMELYHLGEVSQSINPFVKQFNTALIRPALVKPTLSPKDPNFPAWWEQHKSEWEEAPKKEGQEPADN